MVTVSAAVDEVRPGVLAGNTSAVSWPAIFAGAVSAAALSLILLVLGTGLGLASVSAWAPMGETTKAISWATIGWIVFVAVASSALGGYIAGRLRTRWLSVHTDEVLLPRYRAWVPGMGRSHTGYGQRPHFSGRDDPGRRCCGWRRGSCGGWQCRRW